MFDPSRRRCLAAIGAVIGCTAWPPATSAQAASAAGADPVCRRCRGAGLVPVTAVKPFVWIEGQAAFRAEEALVGQSCPVCQAPDDRAARIEQARVDHEAIVAQHAEWEERLGGKLLLVQTRHAAIHTQLKLADAKQVGLILEGLAAALQKASSSLALVPTRAADYQQVLLWGEDAWAKFRRVMESLYTPEQLGENWHTAGKGTMYDHTEVPHCYFTGKIVREVPPEYFAVKLAATRQIYLATGWKAPAWLAEGFAAYGQHAMLREARVSTIYALGRGPTRPVTLDEARRLLSADKFRPWEKLISRELRDFEPPDYFQALAMVAFLLERQPSMFLSLAERLKAGTAVGSALEESYKQSLAELEADGAAWLARRRQLP
jgi:hypothetical protein